MSIIDISPSPTISTRSGARRLLAGAGAVLAAVALSVAAAAGPAAAHDQIIGSDPAPDAQLETAPSQIVLTYSANLIVLGEASDTTTVLVVDEDGTDWATGEVEVNGPVVTAQVDPLMPAGAYEVRWQVVSSDGHPITGVVPFSVLTGAAPEPTAEPVETTEPAEPVVEPIETAEEAEVTILDSSEEAAAGTPIWIPIVIGIAALIVIVLIITAVMRSRRGGSKGASQ